MRVYDSCAAADVGRWLPQGVGNPLRIEGSGAGYTLVEQPLRHERNACLMGSILLACVQRWVKDANIAPAPLGALGGAAREASHSSDA